MTHSNISRRAMLFGAGISILALAACSNSSSKDNSIDTEVEAAPNTMPAEWEPHEGVFLSWPTETIWGEDTPDVQADIALLATTLTEFESVTMLASSQHTAEVKEQCGDAVKVLEIPVDDLWARDTIPVFVESATGVSGVDFNFSGWGNKQEHDRDADVAQNLLTELNIPRISTFLVAEGGSFETDGAGTLMVTKSSIVNDNRNPDVSQDEIEQELKKLLGVKKVIWFDGVYGEDITDAHVDCLARFVAPGVVLLDVPGPGTPKDDVWAIASEQARQVLEQETDAQGQKFQVIDLPQPDATKIRGYDYGEDFLASYANFYIANGAVIVPAFGDDKADRYAQQVLRKHFPDRKIVPLEIDSIASGGGGIHCATHDYPKIT